MAEPLLMVGPSPSSLVAVVPDPSECVWGEQDVSASDAGRTHDSGATMQKMLVARKVKLQLKWTNRTAEEIGAILRAFDAEYFYVRYLDAKSGTFQVRCFYAGDRSAPVRWFNLPLKGTRYSELSFNIIER